MAAKKQKITLGMSFGVGESAVAIVLEGRLAMVAQESWFTRTPEYALFPHRALQVCLKSTGIEPRDVTGIGTIRTTTLPFWARWRNGIDGKTLRGLKHFPNLEYIHKVMRTHIPKAGLRRASVRYFPRDLAHLTGLWKFSGAEEPVLLMTEGLGNLVTVEAAHIEEQKLRLGPRVFFPNGLDYLFATFCQYLGFGSVGEEYKLEGLASHGVPTYIGAFREIVRLREEPFGLELNPQIFPRDRLSEACGIEKHRPEIFPFYHVNLLNQFFGVGPRKVTEPLQKKHADLARSFLQRLEEIGDHLVRQIYEKMGGDTLALSGPIAFHRSWVGKLGAKGPYRHVFACPWRMDTSAAIGAALLAHRERIERIEGNPVLLGSAPLEEEENPHYPLSLKKEEFKDVKNLVQWVSEQLSEQKGVLLFHGPTELSRSSLGNRSVLLDPRSAAALDRARALGRDPYTEFLGCSIQAEYLDEYFRDAYPSTWMEAIFELKEGVRNKLPALQRADRQCLVHCVKKNNQPLLWGILEAFRKKTGIPILVNLPFTSPHWTEIAHVLRDFSQSDLDHLVLGETAYSKTREGQAASGDKIAS